MPRPAFASPAGPGLLSLSCPGCPGSPGVLALEQPEGPASMCTSTGHCGRWLTVRDIQGRQPAHAAAVGSEGPHGLFPTQHRPRYIKSCDWGAGSMPGPRPRSPPPAQQRRGRCHGHPEASPAWMWWPVSQGWTCAQLRGSPGCSPGELQKEGPPPSKAAMLPTCFPLLPLTGRFLLP